MIVTVELDSASRAKVAADQALAQRFGLGILEAMVTSTATGANAVARQLRSGALDLNSRSGAAGLSAQVTSWLIDQKGGTIGAIGLPEGSDRLKSGSFLEDGGATGGHIRPKNAKALAIPVSREAKKFTSPRDMQGLQLVSRPGKPALLVAQQAKRGKLSAMIVHWVLLSHVFVRPRHWLSRGVENAKDKIVGTFGARLRDYLRSGK